MAARLVSSCRLPVHRMRLIALPVAQTRLQSSSAESLVQSGKVKENESGLKNLITEKLGVTGPWTLGLGLTALLLSKEIYVYNEETIVAVTMFGMAAYFIKKYGHEAGKFLDERSQKILDIYEGNKKSEVDNIEMQIAAQESYEKILTYRTDFFDILRENDAMEREAKYRQQLLDVQTAVKRRFDYQIQLQQLKRQFEQRQLVGWIKDQVLESVKSKPDETLPQCMATIKRLSAAN